MKVLLNGVVDSVYDAYRYKQLILFFEAIEGIKSLQIYSLHIRSFVVVILQSILS